MPPINHNCKKSKDEAKKYVIDYGFYKVIYRNVFDCLLKGDGELIIYFYKDKNIEKEEVKQLFIDSCKIESENTIQFLLMMIPILIQLIFCKTTGLRYQIKD